LTNHLFCVILIKIFTYGGRIMAYKINDNCIACGACVGDCPVDAIESGEPIYIIDPDKCIDCGACQPTCPVEAIEN
jgi:NAD-dependent dihydropyrimidine dehydrogenase PreA subunit